MRALPAMQLMVSVLEQDAPMQTHNVQEDVQVVEPVQEPVPPTPKYWPQVEEVVRTRGSDAEQGVVASRRRREQRIMESSVAVATRGGGTFCCRSA